MSHLQKQPKRGVKIRLFSSSLPAVRKRAQRNQRRRGESKPKGCFISKRWVRKEYEPVSQRPPFKNKTLSSPRLHLLPCLAVLPLLYPAYVHTALHKCTGGSCLATSPPTPSKKKVTTEKNQLLSPAWKLFWRHIYGVLSIQRYRRQHFLLWEMLDDCASERRGRGLNRHLPVLCTWGLFGDIKCSNVFKRLQPVTDLWRGIIVWQKIRV